MQTWSQFSMDFSEEVSISSGHVTKGWDWSKPSDNSCLGKHMSQEDLVIAKGITVTWYRLESIQTGFPNQNDPKTLQEADFGFDSSDDFETVVKFSTNPVEIILQSSRYQCCLHDSRDRFPENSTSLIKMEKSWSSLIIENSSWWAVENAKNDDSDFLMTEFISATLILNNFQPSAQT